MPKQRKHRLVLYVKDSARAIGIIERLWAVGELTDEQRQQMVAKIDAKHLVVEAEKKEKLKKQMAQIRAFYTNNDTDSSKTRKE